MRQPRQGALGPVLAAALAALGTGAARCQDPFAEETPDSLSSPGEEDPFETSPEESILFGAEPLITSVSKRPQRIEDAPANVHVIPSADLRRYGYRTVYEALTQVPGVFISDATEFGTIAMRGPAIIGDFNSRVLVLLDGHPLNEMSRNTAAGSDLAIPIDLVDRIEVMKGPGSSIYGTSAFFGVVNVVTKSAEQLDGFQAAASWGSFDAYGLNLAYGSYLTKDLQVVASGSYLKNEGHDERIREYDAVTAANREKSGDAYLRVKYRDFTIAARTSERDREQPGAPFVGNFGSHENRYRDKKTWGEVTWAPSLGENGTLQLRAYYDYYRFDDFLDYRPFEIFRDRNLAETRGAEAVVSLETSADNRLTVGAEYQITRAEYRSWSDGGPEAAQDRAHFGVLKLFVEDDWRFADDWRLVAGVQYNQHELFDRGFSPRGALIWTPTPADAVKLIYSQGFRNPSYIEAFFDDSTVFAGNRELSSERFRYTELVYEHRFGAETLLQFSGFYGRARDVIRQEEQVIDGVSRLQFQNSQQFEVYGVEGSWRTELDSGVRAFANATLQDENGPPLVNYPHWIVNAGLSYPLLRDRLFASATVHAVAKRDEGEFAPDAERYGIVDFVLYWREFPFRGAETTAGLFNAFDAEVLAPTPLYFLPELLRTQRRALGVKLLIRF